MSYSMYLKLLSNFKIIVACFLILDFFTEDL